MADMDGSWTSPCRSVREQFVFGYGSLAATPASGPSAGFVAELRGRRRVWGVAMDNRRDLPGYKYYSDPLSGARPPVFVAFLDITAAAEPGAAVTGLCLPVDACRLRELDRRERNYQRIEVTGEVVAAGGLDDATIWAYEGSAEGRARLREGRRLGAAVVDAGYLRDVETGFRALGEAAHRACLPSLHPGDLPVVELRRHELGGSGEGVSRRSRPDPGPTPPRRRPCPGESS